MKDATCQDDKMTTYCKEVHRLEERSDGINLHHILRLENEAANFLAKLASS